MKKSLPLELLKGIQEAINGKHELIRIEKGEKAIVVMRDADPDSEFYFCIRENTSSNKGSFPFLVTVQPSGRNSNKPSNFGRDIGQVIENFKEWVAILEEYNNLKTIFDDPVITGYQNEFFADYIVLDEDGDRNPFEISKQAILDEYLKSTLEKLEVYKNESNKDRIESIQGDIQELRTEVSRSTKSIVMKKLSKIWAKCTKEGIDIVKDIYLEGKKKFIKFVLENGVDTLSGFLD